MLPFRGPRAVALVALWLSWPRASALADPADVPPLPAQGRAPGRERIAAPPLLVTPELARETIRAALRAAGHPAVRRLLASLAARARSSALLPEVWLRGIRSTDDALHLSPTLDDPYHYTESGGIRWLVEARLVWHLDRLVFDRDEIAVERLRADREGDAARLASKVVELLFAWQRAALAASDPKLSEEEQERARLAGVEAEVTLDVLTRGWFVPRVHPRRIRR